MSICGTDPILTDGRRLITKITVKATNVRILKRLAYLNIGLTIDEAVSQRDDLHRVILRQFHDSTLPTKPFRVNRALIMA